MTTKKSTYSEAEARGESITEDLKKTFENLENHPEAEALKKSADQIATTVTEFIQEHPLPMVIAATAVGFIIGFFAGRRK